eukprot:CAMPEP_0182576436 /NCGR_PEP_ID=MMETSP1324-20130603/33890_1 /TAXON_ID=236786 /ORGANISM="Florenciella sp., Strain RCC1587" /LENGTH=52 /DNA_ID=CAMNT_0024792137 /DNA_START=51 /DNA_END=206 /DNA_ORIENTATION=+
MAWISGISYVPHSEFSSMAQRHAACAACARAMLPSPGSAFLSDHEQRIASPA